MTADKHNLHVYIFAFTDYSNGSASIDGSSVPLMFRDMPQRIAHLPRVKSAMTYMAYLGVERSVFKR